MNLELGFKLTTGLASLLVIGEKMYKSYSHILAKRKSYKIKTHSLFIGNWDNQGQIRNKPPYYVDMSCYFQGHIFKGDFNVCDSNDLEKWKMYRLVGKRRGNTLECEILEQTEGLWIAVAKGILKNKDSMLSWSTEDALIDEFPTSAVMLKGLPKIA